MASKSEKAEQSPAGGETAMNGSGTQSDKSASSQSAAAGGTSKAGSKNAVDLLKADHREVEKMFAEFEKASDNKKDQLAKQICKALTIHAMLEEEIFYPACREKVSEEDMLNEAQVEHDSVKILIAEVWGARSSDPFRDAKVKVMSEQVKHHVGEEEKPRSGIFAKAQEAGVDLAELGMQMAQRKTELEAQDDLAPGEPVSIQGVSTGNGETTKESMMASMQEGRGGSRSRSDDRGSRSVGRERDDDGRFTSSRGGRWDDYDDRGSRRARSRDDDDRGGRFNRSRDDEDGRGHGRGGWFGDSEGHSEAARRGWDDRDNDRGGRFGSSRGRDDDRGDRSSRGRDDDDGRGHGRGGWFGDSRGQSEAARRGWEDRDDDRGGRSSRGRGRDDDDRGSRSSRSSRDDDRGRGGWFGDSRGHSEAARRGWDSRH